MSTGLRDPHDLERHPSRPIGNIEPTRARVQYCGAGFYRLFDGMIQDAWIVGDTQERRRALGITRDGDLRL
jgi:predicted ester cyclase